MSRPITLVTSDDTQVIGNVLLESDYPSDPEILIWHGRYFVGGNMVYGAGSPGGYETYIETASTVLEDKDISAPDVIPTVIVGK